MLPDVPTIAEAGVPGYEAANWWGLVAPAGTPPAIVDKLHAAIAAVQDFGRDPQAPRARGRRRGAMSPQEFGAFMASEMDKWGKVVKESGIKAQ